MFTRIFPGRSGVRPTRPRPVTAITAACALVATGVIGLNSTTPANAATLANTASYNLSLALQESLYFYDAEKSGPSRSTGHQPLEWRGDSEPSDAKVPLKPLKDWEGTNLSASFISKNKAILDPDGDGTVDLSGGFHDAGDHVKFGLPQAYAASTVGWGLLEFKDAFVANGAWEHGLEEMRWFSDYFLRSAFRDASGNIVAFNYQVGDGSVDHAYWGPPELQSAKTYPRPAYFATTENPASDQTASHAAALAIEYLLVKDTDPTYAKKCLDLAKALYDFSVKNRGLGYSGGFYGSSEDSDEMSWGAVWLYRATGDHKYVDDVVGLNAAGSYAGYMGKIVGNSTNTWQNIWVHSWEAKWGGVFAVLDPIAQTDSKLTDKAKQDIHYFNKWQVEYWSHVPHDNTTDTAFIKNSTAGYAIVAGWGSARYNTAAGLEAVVYRKNFPNDPKSVKFSDWAMGQMNYTMGDNPLNRSLIVGFGADVPAVADMVGGKNTSAQHPHHAAAHGSNTNNQDQPATHRHVLWGALVGGPDEKDNHNDITTDYVLNEVAVDYNAAMVGDLAGLWQFYGQGQKMAKFTPPAEASTVDYYPNAESTQVTDHSTQVTVTINNYATRPPHFQTDLSAKYFFNISELYKHGQDASAVTSEVFYDAGAASYGQPAKIGQPVRWGGTNSCIYSVTIDWSGVDVVGSRPFQFGLNESMSSDWKTYWDPKNDPSYAGLPDGKYKATADPNIPVYAGGKLIYGQEPSTTLDESCKPADPGDPTTGPDTASLTAQYANTSASATGGQIGNKIQLTNTGTEAVPLANVTVRYWFTAETDGGIGYSCDYTPIGCANVKATFGKVTPTVTGADRYLELSFTSAAGKINAGGSVGPIQSRMSQASYGNFSQADDYSYRASTTMSDWTHVTVYYNGKLVYGTPPA